MSMIIKESVREQKIHELRSLQKETLNNDYPEVVKNAIQDRLQVLHDEIDQLAPRSNRYDIYYSVLIGFENKTEPLWGGTFRTVDGGQEYELFMQELRDRERMGEVRNIEIVAANQ